MNLYYYSEFKQHLYAKIFVIINTIIFQVSHYSIGKNYASTIEQKNILHVT